MEEKRCYGCMKQKHNSPVCEHCGFDETAGNALHQLPIGTVLRGQYQIGKVLGQGGFGITYLGWDMNLEVPIAIKEYYPSGFVSRDCTQSLSVYGTKTGTGDLFQRNKERFLREAKVLAKLWNVPQIVRVLTFCEENNTAYIIMEYVQGTDLRNYIRMRGGRLSVEETFSILRPIMDALTAVHQAGLVHRDISPDNIMLMPDGTAKLLDFGAVRQVEDADSGRELPRSTEAILKHGFAPIEQYQRRGTLGPWTDIYALCATIHYCLTGKVPSDAPERMMDGDIPIWNLVPGLAPHQTAALEKGMAVMPKSRTQNIEELKLGLFSGVISQPPAEQEGEMPVTQPKDYGQSAVSQNPYINLQDIPTVAHSSDLPPMEELLRKDAQGGYPSYTVPLQDDQSGYPSYTVPLQDGPEGYPLYTAPLQEGDGYPLYTAPLQDIPEGFPLYTPPVQNPPAMEIPVTKPVEEPAFQIPVTKPVIDPVTPPAAESAEEELTAGQVVGKAVGAGLAALIIIPVVLIILLLIMMVIFGGFDDSDEDAAAVQSGTGWEENVLMWDDAEGFDYADYSQDPVYDLPITRGQVVTVTFLDSTDDAPFGCLDASEAQNDSVRVWAKENGSGYDLYIGADGGINGKLATKEMFKDYINLTTVSFNGAFHTDQAENMGSMFAGCRKLAQVDTEYLDTSSVTRAYNMFSDCSALTTLDVSGFDTSSMQDVSTMFNNCVSLTTLDVSGFDTSSVTKMLAMFQNCERITSLDVTGWDVSNVEDMGNMFSTCRGLTELDVSTWDTSSVTNMGGMFQCCSGLTSLDLSSFNTSNVTDMGWMFNGSFNLESVDVSSFDTSKVTDMAHMFDNCMALTNVDAKHWDTSSVEKYEDFMDEGMTFNNRDWEKLF